MIPDDWKYYVLICDTHTGEERRHYDNMEWGDHSAYFWTDGNFGCDCNRSLCWYWANGEDRPDGQRPECDGGRYNVQFAVMRDGQVIEIDGVLGDV